MSAETDAALAQAADIGQREIGAPAAHAPPYRLRRLDTHNWVIERQQPKGKWVSEGYFPKLEMAAQRLLDKVLLTHGEASTPMEIMDLIKHAREYVAEAVRSITER